MNSIRKTPPLACLLALTLFSPRFAAAASTAWGYVWAQQATGNYVASATYARNSSAGFTGAGIAHNVSQLGVGRYRVDFPNLGSEIGGNVQVTAYGNDSARCKVQNWNNSGTTLRTFVRCFRPNGSLVNARFAVSYVRDYRVLGTRGGYLWANRPTAASYVPSAAYQWNSTGAVNTVTRLGTGSYNAHFPGLSFSGGTVQVTAYGSNSHSCKVASWTQSGFVRVRCFDTNGNAADAQFTLNLSRHYPNLGFSYSFAWANQPGSALYTPSLAYQRGFVAGDVGVIAAKAQAGRTGPGRYFVDLPGMSATGSSAKVTAYGNGSETCNVVSWFARGTGTRVRVNCFTASGAPVDTRFVVVYTDDQIVIL